MIALQLLRNDITPLKPEDKVFAAHEVMDDYKVSHLPIVDGDEYLGLVSEGDLLDAPDENLSVKEGSSRLVRAYISADKHLFDAIDLFHEFALSMLPVLDTDEHYMGYLHPQDIVVNMGSMLSTKIPGAIVVLEVNQHDFQMSQIAQIVEGNDAKIVASYITSSPTSTTIEVTLRINRKDLTPILQTFQRYDYTISATYHESVHAIDMKDRFDNFMKYLNM
jgi:acetoin utilization protein AcuB